MERNIRRVTTERSVWEFDADLMTCTRFPRNENPNPEHGGLHLPYAKVGAPREITAFFKTHNFGYDRIEVHFLEHPNDPADTNYVAWSGEIEEDSNPELEIREESRAAHYF